MSLQEIAKKKQALKILGLEKNIITNILKTNKENLSYGK